MNKSHIGYRRRQRGIALPLFAAAMVAVIAMGGLALDYGHVFLNRAQLQNLVDMMALAGAKVLDQTHDTDQATAAANQIKADNLPAEMTEAALDITIEYSDTLIPFTAGGSDPKYIRVTVNGYQTPAYLIRVLDAAFANVSQTTSAVAGPSPPLSVSPGDEICDVVPMVICGDPSDPDCGDGSCYGYDIGAEEEIVLKTGAEPGQSEWEVGPGNFRLIELECGTGANCVRKSLAGEYESCLDPGGTVTSEPGNSPGPVAQGLNTRFGQYKGPTSPDRHPPDTVSYPNSFMWWNQYDSQQQNGPHDHPAPEGVPRRREVAVPIADCTGTTNGTGPVDILAVACFFLTQPAEGTGHQRVYGQMIESCRAQGEVSEAPGPAGPSVLKKIQLYKDPDSLDS